MVLAHMGLCAQVRQVNAAHGYDTQAASLSVCVDRDFVAVCAVYAFDGQVASGHDAR